VQFQRVCHDTLPWLISVSLGLWTPHLHPLRADALPYIERLIDAWCERRAIGPLRWILSGAYPGLYHTDQWLTVSTRLRPLRDFAMSSSRQKRKDWLRAALGILQEIFEPLEVVNAPKRTRDA